MPQELMKKCSEEMQTLHTGCSKAEPKFFAPLQTPFPGSWSDQNLISWRWSVPSPTDPAWWGSMKATSSYHGNRPTHTHPHTGPITIHCAAAKCTLMLEKYQTATTGDCCQWYMITSVIITLKIVYSHWIFTKSRNHGTDNKPAIV